MAAKKLKAPKYPRVMVSPERHVQLQEEAKKRKVHISVVAEEAFKKNFKK